MTDRQVNQWRTFSLVVFACVALGAAFGFALWRAGGDASRLFDSYTDAVVWLVAAAAFKSAAEHLGKGKGVKGARAALFTDERPGA